MKNHNKQVVSRNIKVLMSKALLTPEALSSKAGISRYQLDNLLYCRALSMKTLEKVATALNTRVDRILIDDQEKSLTETVDMKIYTKIISSIDKMLTEYNLVTTRFVIDRIAAVIYNNYETVKDYDETARGILLFLKDTDPDIRKNT